MVNKQSENTKTNNNKISDFLDFENDPIFKLPG